ncbi:GTP pyrophosphokinase [Pseudomonas viridiflava]|uniref:GTP pyrophosphokinase n=1 Tax=Pseudomonas viridiflava TaxID=33069 RepID=UPI000F04543C|nr:(p)ppGpp synthetase [Pseudomonas viridiflava]
MSDVATKYREIAPKLERLKNNLKMVLEQIIEEKQIPVFAVESRVKDEISILNKLGRKNYGSSLEQIDDLCGVRVICYYQEDIDGICEIVEREFEVVEKENKQDSLADDQFGYASYHYVVRLKKEWLAHPTARGLDGFRAEIQIRTMLMHTWAAISHKLLYKREADVPPQFKRKLNRLSALIEMADEQFDLIKNIKIKYVDDFIFPGRDIDESEDVNSDSLIAVQQHYFPGRRYLDSEIPTLVDEIRMAGFGLKKFIEKVCLCLPVLSDLEQEEAREVESTLPLWNFSGVVRTILDLTSDIYFESRGLPEHLDEMMLKYRKIIGAKTSLDEF